MIWITISGAIHPGACHPLDKMTIPVSDLCDELSFAGDLWVIEVSPQGVSVAIIPKAKATKFKLRPVVTVVVVEVERVTGNLTIAEIRDCTCVSRT